MFIDLHTHSTASDGSFSPRRLVEAVLSSGLSALAITDHDTAAGVEEALQAGAELGLEVVSGVEISARHQPGQMHIVGLFVDHRSTRLNNWLKEREIIRDQRNAGMISKLRKLGIDISLSEVEAEAAGVVGRPHIAKVLIRKGVVESVEDAFRKYLARGKKAYCDRVHPSPEDSIREIHRAGGLAILAHYIYCGTRNEEELGALLRRLKEMGLDGMEIYYSDYTPAQAELAARMAQRVSLLPSGGSDFHGDSKPQVKLGSGYGNLRIPYRVLGNLKEALNKLRIKNDGNRNT